MMKETLSVLRSARQALRSAGISNYENEALWLLCHVLDCSTEQLYLRNFLNEDEQGRFEAILAKRLDRTPIQYLLGTEFFLDLELQVRPGVLIPRPETEMLVNQVLEFAEKDPTLSVLDLCTGSGAIGLSVAHQAPFVRVTCADLSNTAVAVTGENAAALGLETRVEVLQGDLFAPVLGRTFNVIVSNPPYIPSGDIASLEPEVREYEPMEALDGGADGLDFYRIIAGCAPDYLNHRGYLVLEIGIGQGDDVAALMAEEFEDVRIYEDFSGIERMVVGRKKTP
jgi:release factor glutamine methyltransferase